MATLYRFEIQYSNSDGDETGVYLRKFPVVRETEYTYFISNPYKSGEKRVKKNAYNTFAFETEEKAKEHFIRRTSRRIDWFDYWKEECKKALKIIKIKNEKK